jgi:predicted MFS family arabinose efflux permease
VADIVARPQLSNAVALTRTGRDMTQVAGPVVGGFLLSRVGMSWVYTVVGSLYFVAAFLASRLRPPRRTPSGTKASVLGGLLETVQYIRMHQLILALLLVAFLVNLTGFPLIFGLMPVFARNVLGTDPTGLGRLMGAYAIGATLGSITIAALVRMGRPGRVVLAGSLGWHGAILVVSRMRLFMPSIAVLAVAGVAQSFTMVTLAILLLSSTDTAVRGRIMGVRALAVYGLPMGLVISAAMADLISTPTALVVDATVGIALTLAIAVSLRSLWRHA